MMEISTLAASDEAKRVSFFTAPPPPIPQLYLWMVTKAVSESHAVEY
jgi:hypothetical protein